MGQVVGGGGSGEADGEDQGSYKVLKQRMKRCQELQKVSLKMKTQKDLMVMAADYSSARVEVFTLH